MAEICPLWVWARGRYSFNKKGLKSYSFVFPTEINIGFHDYR